MALHCGGFGKRVFDMTRHDKIAADQARIGNSTWQILQDVGDHVIMVGIGYHGATCYYVFDSSDNIVDVQFD